MQLGQASSAKEQVAPKNAKGAVGHAQLSLNTPGSDCGVATQRPPLRQGEESRQGSVSPLVTLTIMLLLQCGPLQSRAHAHVKAVE